MAHLKLHDGSLSFNGFTKVIYRGKEFNAPIELSVLIAWDYIYYLLKNK